MCSAGSFERSNQKDRKPSFSLRVVDLVLFFGGGQDARLALRPNQLVILQGEMIRPNTGTIHFTKRFWDRHMALRFCNCCSLPFTNRVTRVPNSLMPLEVAGWDWNGLFGFKLAARLPCHHHCYGYGLKRSS